MNNLPISVPVLNTASAVPEEKENTVATNTPTVTQPQALEIPALQEDSPLSDTDQQIWTIDHHETNQILKHGEHAILTLNSNPSTGYSWHVKSEHKILEIKDKRYRQHAPHAPKIVGAPGFQSMRIHTKEKGNEKLHLIYKRAWCADSENDKQMTLNVEVV
jgi:predicted secreted protein